MKRHILPLVLLCLIGHVIAQTDTPKFLPPEGKTLLIIGQDLGSVGGFDDPNNNGYVEKVMPNPGGVTTYTDVPNLGGMKSTINYGAGDVCGQCIVSNPKFDNSVLNIGLYLVDQLDKINEGKHDLAIKDLGLWIKSTNRPVFLRIGYEFDGTWNHYNPEAYKSAFKHIVDIFRANHVNNLATVWHSGTSPVDDALEGKHENIADWYPGDEYVDWMGYSWFLSSDKQHELTDELVEFARIHNKPVMVAESASQGYDLGRETKRNFDRMIDGPAGENSQKKDGKEIWSEWFQPYFDYIEKHKDVIRIVSYIDCNWDAQAMWGPPYNQGYWGDTRVESNKYIKKKWLETVTAEHWLHGSPDLFEKLGFQIGG